MNRAVLLQIKNTVKTVDTTNVAVGKRAPPPIRINGELTDQLSLENMCLSQVVHKLLANITDDNFSKVSAQLANVPSDVKIKILQYMAVRRELGELSTLAALTNFYFTVFIAPRNHKLTNAWAKRFASICPNLEVLDMRGCAGLTLVGILDIVNACGKNLVHLDISGIKPCTVPALVNILQCTPNLKYLGVRDTDEDFSALTNLPEMCPRLQQLELSYNRGFGVPLISSFVHSLPDLQWVDFSWCSGFYDECVELIAKTLGNRLVALNLEMCCRGGGTVTDVSIMTLSQNCPNLEHLSFNALKFVTDTAICAIAQQCPSLKSLQISGCEVTDVGINAIATHCKNLELFSMVGLPLVSDDSVLKILENCEKLQLLDMANCIQVTPETKAKFGKKLFHNHPETNTNYIPFRVGKQGIVY
eukprot:Phypoly_transcript_09311.p1 GENE.Phypoly_transcript_09311~~Phypoly_transcript_09311.p1  ORF type:complete len:426 (+),score=66.77 Phypoly_transcript_09311:30-1280(+)